MSQAERDGRGIWREGLERGSEVERVVFDLRSIAVRQHWLWFSRPGSTGDALEERGEARKERRKWLASDATRRVPAGNLCSIACFLVSFLLSLPLAVHAEVPATGVETVQLDTHDHGYRRRSHAEADHPSLPRRRRLGDRRLESQPSRTLDSQLG